MRVSVHLSKVMCTVYISYHVSFLPSLLISSSFFTEDKIDQQMQWCATGLIMTFLFLIGNLVSNQRPLPWVPRILFLLHRVKLSLSMSWRHVGGGV